MAAAALTRGSLRLDRSRADIDAELAGGVCGDRELLPEVDTRLIALICCAIACLVTGAFSPQPEEGRALGGAMTWAVWMIGYLILKVSVGAPLFCAETAVTLTVALVASIIGSCIFHKKLRNRTKKKKRKQSRKYRK